MVVVSRAIAVLALDRSFYEAQVRWEIEPRAGGSRLRVRHRSRVPPYWSLDPRWRHRRRGAVDRRRRFALALESEAGEAGLPPV